MEMMGQDIEEHRNMFKCKRTNGEPCWPQRCHSDLAPISNMTIYGALSHALCLWGLNRTSCNLINEEITLQMNNRCSQSHIKKWPEEWMKWHLLSLTPALLLSPSSPPACFLSNNSELTLTQGAPKVNKFSYPFSNIVFQQNLFLTEPNSRLKAGKK